jgi:hypothetical protein
MLLLARALLFSAFSVSSVVIQKLCQSASNQSVSISAKKVRVNQCLCQSASEKFVSIHVNSWLIFSVLSVAEEFLVLGKKADLSTSNLF